jgi:hypothetical protein
LFFKTPKTEKIVSELNELGIFLSEINTSEFPNIFSSIEKMPDEKTRNAYMKVVEKELKAEFEEPLKDLSMTQGKILLKLIDRETGNTSYELVKDLRGGFQAFMWQSIARIFGSNMKSEYDPTGEDIMIERAIKLIEEGQF